MPAGTFPSQQLRFCESFDGTRIAYAVAGDGPAIVKAPHWLTHLEFESQSPIWRRWIAEFAKGNKLVRMDQRGCGLSDRDVREISFDACVRDLEAIVDATGLERFALFGHSQGAAFAIDYAARHPERVSHLVLLGAYSRGGYKRDPSATRRGELEAQLKLIEAGWGRDDPSYRQMFSFQFMPGATLDQLKAMSELQRVSTSAANAIRLVNMFLLIDVSAAASKVSCPTLVLHARDDLRVPFEEGRRVASIIRDARFVPLETSNHILVEQDPAFQQFFDALREFVPHASRTAASARFRELTARELDVLERIARGLDNAQIAASLELSEKTVRNNITRIFAKLEVENRPQAIVIAREAGFGRTDSRSQPQPRTP